MFQYSENNHYMWRWSRQDIYSLPLDITKQKFIFSIGKCSRPALSFRDECISVAKKISNNTTKPIRVLMSGGSDSQVMFLSFIMAGVEFEPLIIRTTDDEDQYINDHDTQAAFELCSKFNKTPIISTVKWYDALDNGLKYPKYLYKNFNVPNIHFLTEKFSDYCLVIGIGPQDKHYYLTSTDFVLCESPCQHSQYGIDHNIEIITFFMYTPELWLSMIDNESMRLFRKALPSMEASMLHYTGDNTFMSPLSHRRLFLINDWWKPLLFCEQWPEILQRPKYHGYELAYTKNPNMVVEYIEKLITRTQSLVSTKTVLIPIQEIIDYMKTPGPYKEWASN